MPVVRRVFVTGGSGFVGRNLLEALYRRRVPTIALARSDAAAAACAGRGAQVARGELGDVASLAAGMIGCDVVIHAAARVLEWDAPAVFEKIDVEGTANVLAAARKARVARFVHVGTEAVLVGGGPIVAGRQDAAAAGAPAARLSGEQGGGGAAGAGGQRPAHGGGAAAFHLGGRRHHLAAAAGQRGAGGAVAIDRGRALPRLDLSRRQRGRGDAAGGQAPAREGEAYFLTDGAPVEFRGLFSELLSTQGIDAGDASMPRALARALAASCEALARARGYRWRPPVTRAALKLMGEEVTVLDLKARTELGYTAATRPEQGLRAMRDALESTVG